MELNLDILRRKTRYYLIKDFIRLVTKLPLSKVGKLKQLLIKGFNLFGKNEIEKAKNNLPAEFADRKEEIIKGMVENIATLIIEVLFYDKIVAQNPNYCKVEGWEIVEEVLKEGKTPFFLTGHFGNWELVGYALSDRIKDLAAVARANNFNKMTSLINSYREKHGVEMIMEDNIHASISRLKAGKPVYILCDLNAREWGYQVDFFGRKASFYSAPVIISMRGNAPLIPIFLERNSDGTTVVRVQKPIEWVKGESMKDRIQKYARIYEEEFRAFPELWCWNHDRYKHADQGKV